MTVLKSRFRQAIRFALIVVAIIALNAFEASAQTFRNPSFPGLGTLGSQEMGSQQMGSETIVNNGSGLGTIVTEEGTVLPGVQNAVIANPLFGQGQDNSSLQIIGGQYNQQNDSYFDPSISGMTPVQRRQGSGGAAPFLPETTTPNLLLDFNGQPQPMSVRREPYPDQEDSATIDADGNRIEIIRQRYPNGKTQIERHVTQDKEGNFFNHGPWILKSPDGKAVAAGTFEKNMMQGQWMRIHGGGTGLFTSTPFNLFQGPFTSVATFEKGELNGLWTITDKLKRKVFEIPYRDGIRHGTAVWWYPNANRMRQANFKEGILDGMLIEWDERKEIQRRDEFIDGQKVVRQTSFYRPNQRRQENYYREGKLELEGKDSWFEAQPAPYVPTGEKVQHGPALAWYQNGQPRMRGQYKDGERTGRFEWWHANGQKQLDGTYKDGQKDGLWSQWYANGLKSVVGTFEADQPVGEWIWWNQDGTVKDRQDMSAKVEDETDAEDVTTEEATGPRGDSVMESDQTNSGNATGATEEETYSNEDPFKVRETDPRVDPFEKEEENNRKTPEYRDPFEESNGDLPKPNRENMEEVEAIEESNDSTSDHNFRDIDESDATKDPFESLKDDPAFKSPENPTQDPFQDEVGFVPQDLNLNQ